MDVSEQTQTDQTDRRSAARMQLEASVPDAILPEQYFARLQTRPSDRPEQRLMLAVLLDAIIHLRRRGTKHAAEAEAWIRSSGGNSPFAFRNICEALGLEPRYVARGILAWCERGRSGPLAGRVRQLRTTRRRITQIRARRRRLRGTVRATG